MTTLQFNINSVSDEGKIETVSLNFANATTHFVVLTRISLINAKQYKEFMQEFNQGCAARTKIDFANISLAIKSSKGKTKFTFTSESNNGLTGTGLYCQHSFKMDNAACSAALAELESMLRIDDDGEDDAYGAYDECENECSDDTNTDENESECESEDEIPNTGPAYPTHPTVPIFTFKESSSEHSSECDDPDSSSEEYKQPRTSINNKNAGPKICNDTCSSSSSSSSESEDESYSDN